MRAWLRQLNELETPMCRVAARPVRRSGVRRAFALISRLGDGIFWYSLIAVMAIADGSDGFKAALHMLTIGAVALILYKSLKRFTRRDRPCDHSDEITALVPPLDRYSFPSGHTLHAVSFTVVAVHYYPNTVWILAPFAALVAASRVILGLHYPTDVLVAVGLGLSLGYASIRMLG